MRKLATGVTCSLRRLRRRRLLLPALLVAVVLAALAALPVRAAGPRQESELLQNPGFEDGFYLWNGNNSIQLGTGWTPWWIENPEHDPPYTRPEYRQARADQVPFRVHGGESAQQWFKLHSSYYAGVYQQASEVTPEQAYRFSLWAQVWSSTEDEPEDVSSNPVNPHLQIGIDPYGNVDPFSADIIWSYEAGMHEVIDGWSQLTVEAVARDSSVTVFVRSRPEFANKHNNVFIDSASLQLIVPPTPTLTPTVAAPTVTPTTTNPVAVAATATPTATVVVTETVAAEPPTAAPAATATGTVAATPTSPPPTETPASQEPTAQPPQPTPPPAATETAPPLPSETAPVAVADTPAPPAPTDTVAATPPEPTRTAPPEVTATGTAPPTGTAVAMISPTAVEALTAPASAPEESGEVPSGRGLLCTAPILMIGLFGLALVVVRRRLH